MTQNTTYQIQEKFGDLNKRVKSRVIQSLAKLIGEDNTNITSIIGPDYFAYPIKIMDAINPDYIETFREGFEK